MRLFYGWYVVAAACVAISLSFGLAYYNNPVFYPLYINEFHWSRTMVASGSSVNFVVFGIMSPIVGMLGDKFSVKRLILCGISCDVLSKIAFSFMGGISTFYLANVLVGIGIASTSLLTVKLLLGKWFKKKEGTALGIVSASGAVGGLGPILTSYLLTDYGWREVQIILAVLIGGVAIPVFWFVVRDTPQELGLERDGDPVQQPPTQESDQFLPSKLNIPLDLSFRQALTTPTLWLISSATLFSHICSIAISQHFVLFLTDMGLTLASASAGLSLLVSSSIIGRFGFGFLSDRYSKKRLLILAYLMFSLMSFMLFLIGLPALSFAKGTVAIYAIAIVFGIGYGGGIICLPLVTGQCFGLSSLGKIFGLALMFNAVGGIIGPALAGYIFDTTGSYQLAFFLITLAAFVAAGCLFFIRTDLREVRSTG